SKYHGRIARHTLPAGEGPARVALLPARGRRWGAADAQVRDAPPDARDRDARARAGRPEVGPHRRRAAAADAGLGPPRTLSRAAWAQAGRGALRPERARPRPAPGAPRVPPLPRPGRERELEPDGDPGGATDHPAGGDRRRRHDLAPELGPPRRRG